MVGAITLGEVMSLETALVVSRALEHMSARHFELLKEFAALTDRVNELSERLDRLSAECAADMAALRHAHGVAPKEE